MDFNDKYYHLIARGICFSVNQNKLRVKSIFKSNLTEEDRIFIGENKEKIIKITTDNNKLPALKQSNMLFLEERYEDNSYNNIICVLNLSGYLNKDKLVKALQYLLIKHNALRMQFMKDDTGNYQTFLAEIDDLKMLQYDETIISYDQLISDLKNHQFNLSKELPVKITLYEKDKTENSLILLLHHVIADGWSLDILLNDLSEFYLAESQDNSILSETLSYQDYLNWEREYSNFYKKEESIGYWQEKLRKSSQSINLPIIKSAKFASYQSDTVWFSLDQETFALLKQFCGTYQTTISNIFLSVYYLLLSTYSGDSSINIGAIFANRQYEIVESMVGFFVNVLVLTLDNNTTQSETFLGLLKAIQDEFVDSISHMLDINEILQHIQLKNNGDRNSLFQVVYVHQNYNSNNKNIFNLNVSRDYHKPNRSIFDLILESRESEDEIQMGLQYRKDLFDTKFIMDMIENYQDVLKQVLSSPNNKVNTTRFLSPKSYNLLINDWNQIKEYPHHKTLHQLFEEQVNKTPNNIAVVYEDIQLTYRELNGKSNQLAKYIKKKCKVKPDDLIALCLDRSEYTVIAILAVLKAGGAYVPIDPSFPDERINFIIKDIQATVILTNAIHIDRLIKIYPNADQVSLVLAIDSSDTLAELQKQPKTNLKTATLCSNLAYLIYTSGTTGEPNGVLQTHSNVMRLFTATDAWYHFNDKDVWTLFHSYVFDFSVWEMWGALIYGGKLVIPGYGVTRDFNLFYELCEQEHVTILNQTPQAFYQFSEIAITEKLDSKLTNLRYVIFGGDALNLTKLKPWFDQYGYTRPQLINMYGITETTVHVSYKAITAEDIGQGSLIGRLIPDLSAYILDGNLNPLPLGAIGELYVGGRGLARGYLNKPALTTQRFINNPFQSVEDKKQNKNGRLYKTGDLVRYLSDGCIEYIGRNDFQVKIRGYRIEIAEIESALLGYPDIMQSVVLAHENVDELGNTIGNKYLVGYYVAKKRLDEKTILETLSNKLPDYMIPSILLYLEKLPLTLNGKLDKKALPNPEFGNIDNYVAPRNDIENKLCGIFSEILGLKASKIGVRDNFFTLGGDSILAIRLVIKINKFFHSNVKVKDVFSAKTIENICHTIHSTDEDPDQKYEAYSLIDKADYITDIHDFNLIDDIYPASFLQVGMLIESDLYKAGTYHDVFGYIVKAPFDEIKLRNIWQKLVLRHELLRAAFIVNAINGLSVVIYKDLSINLVTKKNKDLNEIINEEKTHLFDYTNPGLFKIIINDRQDEFDFIFSFHHAIADGWSIASLVRDEFISAYIFDKAIQSNLKISYAEFIKQEQISLNNKELIKYWQNNLSDFETSQTKWNFNEEENKEDLYTLSVLYNQDLSKKIQKIAAIYEVSVDTIFLLAYLKTLAFFTNSQDITVGLVSNNRLEIENGDKQFGLFLNTVPYRCKLDDFHNMLKDDLQAIFNHKVELQKYKQIPYGYLKSLFGRELITYAFNFIHFHHVRDGESYIESSSGHEKTNIPLFLNIILKNNARFKVSLLGHASFISKEYLDYFGSYYEKCIFNIVEKSNSNLSLTEEDYNRIIIDCNRTERDYPKNKTIHELFEDQVEKTPDTVAIVYEDMKLTYRQLNSKVNQFAIYLRNTYKIEAEDLIALCLDKSLDMLIAILATLKSGAAYVPIDPDYSEARINFILSDTKAKVLLSNKSHFHRLDQLVENGKLLAKVVAIDSKEIQLITGQQPSINLSINITSNNLAYVIYTSGTTGNPKGVMIEHKSAVNLFMGLKHLIPANSTLLSITNVVFDIAALELLGSLLCGAQLVIPRQNDVKDNFSFLSNAQDKGMEFGLFYFGNYDAIQEKSNNKYELLIEGAKFADANGFTAIWTPERHFSVFGGLYPNPTVTSAAIATITKNIKIRSGSVVLPLHNPIRIAEDWALIDNLSQGRVGLAVATGWHKKDFTLAPDDFFDRKDALVKNLTILQKLWGGGSVDFSGVDGETTEIRTFPNPMQRKLPIWLTVARNPESFRQAGNMGVNLLTHLLGQSIEVLADNIKIYKDALIASKHTIEDKSITLMVHTFISHDEDYSMQLVKEPFKNYLKTSVDLIKEVYCGDDINKLSEKEMDAVYEQAFERYYYTSGLFGTAESCQTMIDKLKNAGVTEIACLIDFGISSSIVLENLQYLNKLRLSSKSTEITHLQCTPSLANVIFDQKRTGLQSLTTLLIGGESVDLTQIRNIQKNTAASIYNMYGPTETTIWATYSPITSTSVNIGIPLANVTTYVLDGNLNPLPIGAIGELYVGGSGLARGYLNRDDLTNTVFLRNPFQNNLEKETNTNSHIYKTGDLVRLLRDGNLEYIGRNDSQIKIRGHRVELGEIEAKLSQFPGVKQAVVLLSDNNPSTDNRYLVGYYAAEFKLNHADMLGFVKRDLPEYMIPSVLVHLNHLPLTVNGKLDRKALPYPEFIDMNNYVAPSNDLERKICDAYAEVLGLNIGSIGINNSFFKIGGNSISVVKLLGKLKQLFEFKNLSIASLFKYDTVEKLLTTLTEKNNKTHYILQDYKPASNHEIAIIGMSGAFSGVTSVSEFWQIISNQGSGIKTYTLEECRDLGVNEEVLDNHHYMPVAGIVADIDLVDPSFWGMSINEAKQSDPQIRKFVEHCWYVLEQSGYIRERQKLNIGVFSGSGSNDYFFDNILQGEDVVGINLWEAYTLNTKDALATRAAYLLGLTGPANSINTACSTGLVAVVEACKNLSFGTCNLALAGGVSLSMPDKIGYIYQEGMIFSKDGQCRPFDKSSSGTVTGAGVGVVLLKRLDDARKDRDNIIAVIKGYATNNDGDRKIGYTAPSIFGQSECILNAQIMAGVEADKIDYIECHGTATNLGDPIEVQALKEAFAANSDSALLFNNQCYLGSVKSNIGHAGAAAGTAGLIKVCNMLKHSTIPGQLNFNEANPELRLEQTNFTITTTNREWKSNSFRPRLAGVSSFGIGGTNAHVIVGEYIDPHLSSAEPVVRCDDQANKKFIFPLSAKTRKSLDNYKQAFIHYLQYTNDSPQNLAKMAHTLQNKRENFDYRLCISAQTRKELIEKLTRDKSVSQVQLNNNFKLVFMFPGQGSQYSDMAIELYHNEADFRSIIDEVVSIANRYLAIDLHKILYPSIYQSDQLENINETQWAQITLFVISYSLTKYLETIGINADAYIGHSVSEYVAATLAGVFTLDDAIKIVIQRGLVMQEMVSGSMLAINNKDVVSLSDVIAEFNCEIAAFNSPDNIVASGKSGDIDLLQQHLETKNIIGIKLRTSHAYHSRMMERASLLFKQKFTDITLSKPKIDFVANVSGKWAKEDVSTSDYWCQQLRSKVEFSKGIRTIIGAYGTNVLFIEVGAGKALGNFVRDHAKNIQTLHAIQLLPSYKDKEAEVLEVKSKEDILGILWKYGVAVEWNENVSRTTLEVITDLPVYQFDFKSCWIKKGLPPIKEQFNDNESMFYTRNWLRVGSLSESIVNHEVHKNILLLVNDDENKLHIARFITELKNVENVTFVFNTDKNFCIGQYSKFDFKKEEYFKELFKFFAKNKQNIDTIVYFSSTVNHLSPELDVTVIKSIMDLSNSRNMVISKFISISFDNFEIIGTENCVLLPSIVYGVTKSLNTEYLTGKLKTMHFDFDSNDLTEYKLKDILSFNTKKDNLIVVRNNYVWLPEYVQVNLSKSATKNYSNGMVFLLTGGLGAVGYTYSNYLVNNLQNCILLILGSSNEKDLNPDYRNRLNNLRKKNNKVLYIAADIGHPYVNSLNNILKEQGISKIDYVLHAAGRAAKSATILKSISEIKRVVDPKIVGFCNLLQIAEYCKIGVLINCSSISSINPSIGNLEYTAANLFLDEVSYRQYKNIDKVLTINLNQVSDIGMAVDFIRESNSDIRSLNSIESRDIPSIINRVALRYFKGNIVISRQDIIFNQNYFTKSIANHVNIPANTIKILEDGYDDLAYEIAIAFCKALGLEEISLNENFFAIGGNSFLTIKVVNLINERLEKLKQIKLKIMDIFIHKTVNNLAKYIRLNHSDSLIKSLNNSNASELIFMVHPGGGGCEVYANLAHELCDQYKCYGIDNYNIQNKDQIACLYQLAEIYLSYIDKIRANEKIHHNAKYNLFGWSTGGHIAIAIASILEKKGITNIQITSLDTILNDGDENLGKMRLNMDINVKESEAIMMEKYKDKVYVDQVLNAMPTEKLLNQGLIREKLAYTKITLFKAKYKENSGFNSTTDRELLSQHILSLPYNNIDKVITNINSIEVILLNCHHGNILEKHFFPDIKGKLV